MQVALRHLCTWEAWERCEKPVYGPTGSLVQILYISYRSPKKHETCQVLKLSNPKNVGYITLLALQMKVAGSHIYCIYYNYINSCLIEFAIPWDGIGYQVTKQFLKVDTCGLSDFKVSIHRGPPIVRNGLIPLLGGWPNPFKQWKNPDFLGYIGAYKLPSQKRDFKKPLSYKDPYYPTSIMESRRVFCGSSETYASQIGSFPQINIFETTNLVVIRLGLVQPYQLFHPYFSGVFGPKFVSIFWGMLLHVENNGLEETKET